MLESTFNLFKNPKCLLWAEFNYRSQFEDFKVFKDYTTWQKRLLLGLTKKYTVGKKLKGNVQLLYDFLWKQRGPVTQSQLFRVGYGFN